MRQSKKKRHTVAKRLEHVRYAIGILYCASKKHFILYWGLSVFMALFPFLPLYLWKELLNDLVNYQSLQAERLLAAVAMTSGLYCLFMLIEKLMSTFQQVISYQYHDEITYYIDNFLIEAISKADLAYFDSSKRRDQMKQVTGLMSNVTTSIPSYLFDTVQMLLWNVFSFFVVCRVNLLVPLIAIVLSLPAVFGKKKIERRSFQFQKANTKTERQLEYYQGLFRGKSLLEVKLYGLKDYFCGLYKTQWNSLHRAKLRHSLVDCLIQCVSAVTLALGDMMIYVITVMKMILRKVGVGDISYYISIMSEFRERFIGLLQNWNGLLELTDELAEVREFLEQDPLVEKTGTLMPGQNPKIEFCNVCFRYPNAEVFVLEHCNFVIESGQAFGLIGLNGAGKSTIVKLLCRFYDPTEGQILIDGVDAKEYDIVALRKLFGALFQDYVRYSFSLRENVALSDISRKGEDAAILAACERSRVSEFVGDWEDGLDTNMTRQFDPEGKELSGGQWQRVSLARAFFRDAPIVLLDEPSAALDPVAEHEIFENFAKVSEGKSAVLISHRLSSITLCDKILVLENGRIIEQGSHQELMNRNGRYAYLFQLQASKYMG